MNVFAGLEGKLETNVYGSVKGMLRLQLLHRDIFDYCPEFTSKAMTILDIGGGAGYFAKICAEHGQWLEQEMRYYRKPPFSSLGVHTHFLWQAASLSKL